MNLFDLILILILALSVIAGAKKGFAFSLASLVSLAVCGGLAYLSCGIIATPVYNGLVKEKNISTSKKIVEEYVPSEELRQLISSSKSEAEINEFINKNANLKEELILKIQGIISSDGNTKQAEQSGRILDKVIPDEKLTDTLRILITEPTDVAAEYIEENYLRPPAVTVLKIIVFFVVFAILSFVFGFLVKTFIKKIPVMKSADTLLGAVFGVLHGFIIVALMCLVFKFVIYMSEDTLTFINTDSILNSKLFSIVYNMFV
jgi:uncharacterized membrane protein required for colicin V production